MPWRAILMSDRDSSAEGGNRGDKIKQNFEDISDTTPPPSPF
jgi:hypothetical protein